MEGAEFTENDSGEECAREPGTDPEDNEGLNLSWVFS